MPVKVPGRLLLVRAAVIHNSTLSNLNNSTTTYWPCPWFVFDDSVLCDLLDVLILPRENNIMSTASKVVDGVAQRPGCSASHVPDEIGRQQEVVGCEESFCPPDRGPLAVIRDPPGGLGFGGADDAAVDQFENISTR
ncbi:hypothetical protein QR685DRAFT_573746 [Neurospora intermedia]|uniref:Uncharacterized protein n=1 Tax=Neurospora intermedia TaxID=5142 RepID=A0ABR3D701_NEUIN